eukprot:1391329-Pleurochrysis_carterae.AAC.1
MNKTSSLVWYGINSSYEDVSLRGPEAPISGGSKTRNDIPITSSAVTTTARIEDDDAKYLLSASDERKYGKGKR